MNYRGVPHYEVTMDFGYEVRWIEESKHGLDRPKRVVFARKDMAKEFAASLRKMVEPNPIFVSVLRVNIIPRHDLFIEGWSRVWDGKVYKRWRRFHP